MRISRMMLLLPALGLIALAPVQPAQAEHCSKTTSFEAPVLVESQVMVEPSMSCTRVIESPVLVRDTMATPITVTRPVILEKRVVVDRPVMMERRVLEQPVIINQEKRHLLRFRIF